MTAGCRQRPREAVPRCRGISLLETLLAILVFGLMAMAAYSALESISSAAAAQDRAARRLGETQLAVLRLERELHQTVSAGLFPDPAAHPGLLGHAGSLEFDYLAPETLATVSVLKRIRYRHEGRTLYRVPAAAVTTGRAPADSFALLDGVARLEFNYLDAEGNWLARWPGRAAGDLPAGVRLRMELDGIGPVERVFELPGDRP
jgi:general secretion pathway protein J